MHSLPPDALVSTWSASTHCALLNARKVLPFAGLSHGSCVNRERCRLARTGCLAQAEHESAVTSVALSPDGLRAAIATETGTVGVLDVPSHTYATLLRSHVGCVNGVAADPKRCARA